MSLPLYGHVIPTLAIVEELVSRGHRVTYLATGEFTGMLAGAGARTLRYESTWPTPAGLPAPATGDAMARLGLLLASESIVQARCASAQLSGDVPDAVVYDTATSAAVRPLLRLWRCSGVRLFTGVASSERFSLNALLERRYPQRAADPAHPLVRERHRRLQAFADEHRTGRDAADDDVREDVSLVLQPRPFQIAGELFDDRYVFVGPCVGRRPFQGEWVAPGGSAPLVLVSLGTLYNHRLQFFRACVEACADLDCHVVLVVGPRVEPAELGVLPANVEVHRHVAQLAVLEHARAFVTHGGMGSTMEALLTATPLVVVPQTPEQDAVARRVAELGLGWRLQGSQVTYDALRAAVSHALFDEATLRRVRDMQRHAREAGGAARAVDAIEARAHAACIRRLARARQPATSVLSTQGRTR